jgi:putative PIN family toxin of toxin-antitoxin system
VFRAVLEPDVYVTAILQPQGTCGQILRRFLRDGAFEVVVSPAIADEIMRVFAHRELRRQIRSKVEPEHWFEDVLALADLVDDRTPPRVCHDPEDDKYLAAAVEGRANFVITGDQALLALREHERVRIESPVAFLGLLGVETGSEARS